MDEARAQYQKNTVPGTCSLTHTLWNSRTMEIRLFVLRGLEARFSAPFWNG